MRLSVPKFLAKDDIVVKVADGYDENGSPKISETIEVKARVEKKSTTIYNKEGNKVTTKARAFIFEKLESFPDELSGFCTVGEESYDIAMLSKLKNPDGSTNHIVMELI